MNELQKKLMLATDFDGTLCCEGVIETSVKSAISEFREKGNLFGIVTGRCADSSFDFLKDHRDITVDFVISNNGARAFDSDGNTLFSKKIDAQVKVGGIPLVKALVTRCLELTSNFCGFVTENKAFNFYPGLEKGGSKDGTVYCPFSVLDEITEFISGYGICDNPEQAATAVAALKHEFGEYLSPVQNGRCIDITSPGTDKSSGIKEFAELMDIPYDNIWVSGDNYNDIPMVKQYHGCAVENAVDELKNIAEHNCGNVGDAIRIVLLHEDVNG